MANLGGRHKQSGTDREVTYWAAYGPVDGGRLFFAAVFSEGRATLGQYDASLPFDPNGIPAEALVRHALCRYIDKTTFGEGSQPDPRWIGWRPGYL
jgi:hypothetical protein